MSIQNKQSKSLQSGSGTVTKQTLLQQARGSMVNIEKLTEENFEAVAEKGFSFERAKEIFEGAGLDIEKVIIDPTRFIYNVYYADYENGIYLDLHLSEEMLLNEHIGLRAMEKQKEHCREIMKAKEWSSFYFIIVPGPLRIYDFQRRYKDIEPEKVYEVWEGIHKNLDYENGQWRDDVLDYVFQYAPKPENLPINENGMVTVYRGSGTLSQAPERALSWSTSQQNALWFANHNGFGQALFVGEVDPKDVVNYLAGFQDENEVIVRRGAVKNIRAANMIPIEEKTVVKLFASAIPELLKYGPCVKELGYQSEGIFSFHGRSHILRVLMLSLIYFYNSGEDLSERDKNILIYFSLLHDVGRDNEDRDDSHGQKSVKKIESEKLLIPGLELNKKDLKIAHLLIRCHSISDDEGREEIIRRRKKFSGEDYYRLVRLFNITKDMDGLDRVRFNGLDINQLRTDYGKQLPLIAGRLLSEKLEWFIFENQGK